MLLNAGFFPRQHDPELQFQPRDSMACHLPCGGCISESALECVKLKSYPKLGPHTFGNLNTSLSFLPFLFLFLFLSLLPPSSLPPSLCFCCVLPPHVKTPSIPFQDNFTGNTFFRFHILAASWLRVMVIYWKEAVTLRKTTSPMGCSCLTQ